MKRFALLALSTALTGVPMLLADDAPRQPQPPGDGPRVRQERQEGDVPRPARAEGDAPRAARAEGDAPRAARGEGDAPRAARPEGDAPRGARGEGDAPRAARPEGDAPRGARPEGDAVRGVRRDGDAVRGVRPDGDAPRRVEGGRDGVRGRETTAESYIATMDADVTLTDEQKKAMTTVFEARDKAIKDFETESGEKLKTASKALQDAYQTRDREAIGKVQQEYRDVFAPMHEIMRKANEDLAALLTADQKDKLQQKRLVALIKNMAAPAELTDEQIKQLVALAAGSENDRGGIREKVYPAIEQMLTPEQKIAVGKSRTIAQVQGSLGIRMSREQLTQLAAFYDELAKDATIAKEDMAKKLTEKLETVLTDEQKEAVRNRPAPRVDTGERRPAGEGREPAGERRPAAEPREPRVPAPAGERKPAGEPRRE